MQAHVRAQGRTPAGTHVPVLLREVMTWLRPGPGEIVADCTIGYGGHASEFLRRIGPTGRLIGLDVDGPELERTRKRLSSLGGNISLHRRSFAGIAGVPAEVGIDGLDILFADLGVSSMQVDDPRRGFSYKHSDSPLDMRMDERLPRTGAGVLAGIGEQELSQALWELADEPDHAKIARWIVQQRTVQPIERTGQLTRLIFAAKGTTEKLWRRQAEFKDLHHAARTFQALRILVNDELGALRELLRVATTLLRPGGRIGIISFHSGEDRLVKNAFRDGLRAGVYAAISQTVIRPGGAEVRDNPRSSSAKFRWARVRQEATEEPGAESPEDRER
jgi:16S rRNA (cytosine1402-N4)-methyltransferase